MTASWTFKPYDPLSQKQQKSRKGLPAGQKDHNCPPKAGNYVGENALEQCVLNLAVTSPLTSSNFFNEKRSIVKSVAFEDTQDTASKAHITDKSVVEVGNPQLSPQPDDEAISHNRTEPIQGATCGRGGSKPLISPQDPSRHPSNLHEPPSHRKMSPDDDNIDHDDEDDKDLDFECWPKAGQGSEPNAVSQGVKRPHEDEERNCLVDDRGMKRSRLCFNDASSTLPRHSNARITRQSWHTLNGSEKHTMHGVMNGNWQTAKAKRCFPKHSRLLAKVQKSLHQCSSSNRRKLFAAPSMRRFRLLNSRTHRTKTRGRNSPRVIHQQSQEEPFSMIQSSATQEPTGRCNCCSNLRDILIEVLTPRQDSLTGYVHSSKLRREPNGDNIERRYSLRSQMGGALGNETEISDKHFTSRIEVHLPRSGRLPQSDKTSFNSDKKNVLTDADLDQFRDSGTDSSDDEGNSSSSEDGGDDLCIKRRRWTEWEKQRLRSYKSEGKPDIWIASKFKRSESAVMQQWRKMTGKREGLHSLQPHFS